MSPFKAIWARLYATIRARAQLTVPDARMLFLRRNYYFLVSFTLDSVTYALWLLTGFYHPDGGTYLPQMIVVSDPAQLGYILNRISKLFLSIAWITLYVKRG